MDALDIVLFLRAITSRLAEHIDLDQSAVTSFGKSVFISSTSVAGRLVRSRKGKPFLMTSPDFNQLVPRRWFDGLSISGKQACFHPSPKNGRRQVAFNRLHNPQLALDKRVETTKVGRGNAIRRGL
jgi:hypothetical protein